MIVIFIPPKVINIPHLPKFLPTFFHLHLLKNLNEVTAMLWAIMAPQVVKIWSYGGGIGDNGSVTLLV